MKRFRYYILIVVTFIFTLLSTGCAVYGVPEYKSYSEHISGITAYEQYSGYTDVSLELLTNDIEFDKDILEKPYYTLEIRQQKPCYIKAVAFIAKSSQSLNITFQAKVVLKNRRSITDIDEAWEEDLTVIVAAKKAKVTEHATGVILLFPKSVALRGNSLDKLYIVAAENADVEESCEEAEVFKASFKFDGLVVFFDPEYMQGGE